MGQMKWGLSSICPAHAGPAQGPTLSTPSVTAAPWRFDVSPTASTEGQKPPAPDLPSKGFTLHRPRGLEAFQTHREPLQPTKASGYYSSYEHNGEGRKRGGQTSLRNDPSRLLVVLMPHVYQQSNISSVLSERIQSCIVPFSSSGIRTNDPVLPGTKRSGRTGGEDCGKRDGRGIISGMTSVLNHSRLALSARVSERQFSKCHLSLPPTHTDQRGPAHT
ncbi:hypothetical protein QQF64_026724 [Cirrhinus molitorella]|uniref:Uncharacterized protein n=1 Tax=Cirrhinus molitorella TaxID=172907 RepID=A0ABR3NB14_9TELE